MFKRGNLNNVHLDRAALSHVFHDAENENVACSLNHSTAKHRVKNEKKNHHHKGHKHNSGQHKHSPSQSTHSVSKQQTSATCDDSNLAGLHSRAQDYTTYGARPALTTRKDPKKNTVSFYNLDRYVYTVLSTTDCWQGIIIDTTKSSHVSFTFTNWTKHTAHQGQDKATETPRSRHLRRKTGLDH